MFIEHVDTVFDSVHTNQSLDHLQLRAYSTTVPLSLQQCHIIHANHMTVTISEQIWVMPCLP